jgi:hypothetical protein
MMATDGDDDGITIWLLGTLETSETGTKTGLDQVDGTGGSGETVTTAVDGTEAITLLETHDGTSVLATITADDSDEMV